MITVNVSASGKYNVLIGKGILKNIGEYSKEASLTGKALVITDDNVAPLYLKEVKDSLEKNGFEATEYIIKHGEKSKSAENYIKILNFLAENHFTRSDTVFALGGGVVGDLAGFCAACYMRGTNFVQIPTTLLSAVDSSVGGKTAINLDCGKNLAGAFYQPRLVLCDITTLSTLPEIFMEDGMAEVIKYAMIKDKALLDLLSEGINKQLEEVIARCVEAKSVIVNEDEKEKGIRRILNFGHTVGHAIEKASNYTVTHGHAVAAGMYIITNAWEKRGLCEKGTTQKLKELLLKYNLMFKYDFSPDELFVAAQNDKKVVHDGIYAVVVSKIGECEVVKMPLSELLKIIEEGAD